MPAHDQRLYFLIQLVAHRLKKEADAVMREAAGVSTAQAAALTIIASENGVTQQFIADRLGQRESAVQTMSERLLKAGYITRQRSASDARAWELRVTSKGRTALRKISKPFSNVNRMLDDSLGQKGSDRLARALQSVLDALDKQY